MLTKLTNSVAFYGSFATFDNFWTTSRFFPKSPSIFLEKTQIVNALRNPIISVAFYGEFATFIDV